MVTSSRYQPTIHIINIISLVPDIDLLKYLPKFLDGLFNMLKDSTKDIRLAAEACLAEFLSEIKTAKSVDFGSMVRILLTHCGSKGTQFHSDLLRYEMI